MKRASKRFLLTLVLERLPAPEVGPDLRDGGPLGRRRAENLAQEGEGDVVEALPNGTVDVPHPPCFVDRVLGGRKVPRKFWKDES